MTRRLPHAESELIYGLFLDTTKPFQKMYHKNFNQLELQTEQDEWEAKMG